MGICTWRQTCSLIPSWRPRGADDVCTFSKPRTLAPTIRFTPQRCHRPVPRRAYDRLSACVSPGNPSSSQVHTWCCHTVSPVIPTASSSPRRPPIGSCSSSVPSQGRGDARHGPVRAAPTASRAHHMATCGRAGHRRNARRSSAARIHRSGRVDVARVPAPNGKPLACTLGRPKSIDGKDIPSNRCIRSVRPSDAG